MKKMIYKKTTKESLYGFINIECIHAHTHTQSKAKRKKKKANTKNKDT